MTRNTTSQKADTGETAAAAPAQATGLTVAEPAEASAAGEMVEVELTTHHREDGKDYLPGAKIRVSAQRAAALRWSGRAKP